MASDGGGHATLACDALEREGISVPLLGEGLQSSLRAVLPARCPVMNPVDYAGFAEEQPAVIAETLDRCLADDAIGGALLAGHFGGYHHLAGPEIGPPETAAAKRIGEIMNARAKPIVVHSVYAEDDEPAIVALREVHAPVVRSLASAASLLRGMKNWALLAARQFPDRPPDRPPVDFARAAAILKASTAGPLLEPDAYQLLEAYGLPAPRSVVVNDPGACATTVAALDRPAALKVVSRRRAQERCRRRHPQRCARDGGGRFRASHEGRRRGGRSPPVRPRRADGRDRRRNRAWRPQRSRILARS